jgi:hypothetical protein
MLISGDFGATVPMLSITSPLSRDPVMTTLSGLDAIVPMLPILAPLSKRPGEIQLSGCKCDDVSGLSGDDCPCKVSPATEIILGVPVVLATAYATYHVYKAMGGAQRTDAKIGLGIGIFVLGLSTVCGALRIGSTIFSKPS